jgi:PAS domain-containing protein
MDQLVLENSAAQKRSAWVRLAAFESDARVRMLVACTMVALVTGLAWLLLRQGWIQLDTDPRICTDIIAVVLSAMLATIVLLEQRMRRVEATERRFHRLFEATPGCSVLVVDVQGKIQSVNGSTAEIFGSCHISDVGFPENSSLAVRRKLKTGAAGTPTF